MRQGSTRSAQNSRILLTNMIDFPILVPMVILTNMSDLYPKNDRFDTKSEHFGTKKCIFMS